MFDVSNEDITQGPIPRTLVLLALPLVAQNFALVAQQVIDTFWVGRLGTDAVAAIGLVIPIGALLTIPITAIFVGSQVTSSQHVGADEEALARRTPVHAVVLMLLISTVLVGVVYFFAEPVLKQLYPTASVIELGATYMFGWSLSLVMSSLSDGLESGFVGFGDTRSAFLVNLTAIGLNVVLDPFFIFGWGPFPEWGVFGAAIATGVGYAGGGLLAVGIALSGRTSFSFRRDAFWFGRDIFGQIIRTGSPIAAKNAGRQIARAVMISIVTLAGGAAGIAAYTVGARLSTVAFVPIQGLSSATTSVVGQNIGADEPERAAAATRFGVLLGAVALGVIGLFQWTSPTLLAQTFIPEISGQTLTWTIDYLRILAYGYWAFAFIYVIEAGFSGAGRTDLSMYSTLVQYWVVRLPIAVVGVYVLSMGVHAVFWAVTLSNVAAAIGLFVFYRFSTSRGLFSESSESASAD
ncbi:MATE family efflux transporter [Halogeometricum borinquense]|uniref:Multidrug-efflux transporter n=1 Tax=Halogeometricum borinquense TaxID=60847 RepID=A0A482TBJ8_9EURY|nr:MATE family efflux transporter [Halogeometricum borinquense]RYJ13616.1 MATE family efflux transporter [Halogeometricum borinquense]